MLSDLQTIDMIIPIESESLMLVISDMHSWPDPDSNERFGQYMEKLQSYSRYVAADAFAAKHPSVPPTNVVISFVSLVPPSDRMRQIRVVECEKHGSKTPLIISYADETPPASVSAPASATAARHLAAQSNSKRRLLIRGWIVAGIGAITTLAAQLASPLESKNQVLDTIFGVCFWAGALTLVVGFGMVLWSQQDW